MSADEIIVGSKRCSTCKETKAVSAFSRHSTKKDGLRSQCKECEREANRVYNAANPEKAREANRVYRAANPEKVRERKRVYRAANPEKVRVNKQRRRARKANLPNTLTTAEWYYAIDYFHGCCAVCRRQLKNLDKTRRGSADHWIPLTKGGGTTADNIVPLCHGEDGCNNRKHNALPEAWLVLKFGKRKARVILKRILEYFELVKAKDKEVA